MDINTHARVHTHPRMQCYLDAMRVNLLHCGHSDEARTSLVHSLELHLRLEAMGCTLETGVLLETKTKKENQLSAHCIYIYIQ